MLGERIKELRNKRGWTRADLARQSGVTQTTIANLEERSDGNPRLDNLRRIASALEVSVAYLIGEGYPVAENLRRLALENGVYYKDIDRLILMTFDGKETTTLEEWRHLANSVKQFPDLYKRMGRVRGNDQVNSGRQPGGSQ